jgi:hypothetical protein
MRKSCVQTEDIASFSGQNFQNFSTVTALSALPQWMKLGLIPSSLHTFLMQLSARLRVLLTSVNTHLSTLSTSLIIVPMWVTKEKYLIGTGG